MKKVVSLVVLSIALVFGSFTQVAAASQGNSDSENFKKELLELSKQTEGLEFVDANTLPEGTTMINFENMDEFKKAVEEFQMSQEEVTNEESSVIENLELSSTFNLQTISTASVKEGTSRIKWYTSESIESVYKVWLPVSMWIDFSYTYTGSGSSKEFNRIKTVTSNSSGFPSSWYQTSYSANIASNKKSVSIKIQGYHLLGVNIGGNSIGAKFSDSYTKKYSF